MKVDTADQSVDTADQSVDTGDVGKLGPRPSSMTLDWRLLAANMSHSVHHRRTQDKHAPVKLHSLELSLQNIKVSFTRNFPRKYLSII